MDGKEKDISKFGKLLIKFLELICSMSPTLDAFVKLNPVIVDEILERTKSSSI